MSKNVPTGRFRRLSRIAALAPHLGGALLGGAGTRRAVAERMLHTLGELKGGSMKLGQILAQVAEALPEDMQERLGGLFDEAPPLDWESMREVLDQEFDDLSALAEIDPEPFAGASLGQVHRAQHRDGRILAVKIQYPHVAEALEQDLANLTQLAKIGTGGGLVLDIKAQLAAMQDALEAELDYAHELEALRGLQTTLAPWPDLVLPEPVVELCSARVFTTEMLEGPTLHHLGADGPLAERLELAHLLSRAVLLPVFAGHQLNADAHPGNFIVLPGPRLALLDFGAVRDIPAGPAEGTRELIRAVLADPGCDVVPALQQMGFELDASHRRVRRGGRVLRDLIAPCFTGLHDFTNDQTLRRLGEYKQRHPLDSLHFVPPPALIHLMRALLGLMHGLHLLQVEVDLSPTFTDMVTAPGPA